MSYYPYPPYSKTPLNPLAMPFHNSIPIRMTHMSQQYDLSSPEVRNGVYQYPPGYRNPPSPIYPHNPPIHRHFHQPQPLYQTPQATAYSAPVYPPVYAPVYAQPEPKSHAYHHHHHHSHRFTVDDAQRSLPPAQRGYKPRRGDVITTYYPKTPRQIAHENEVQARRDGTYAASHVEPEDKAPDRRWEVIYADGDRDYLTLAQINNGFPGGEWRATEAGQWRYHMGRAEGARRGSRHAARDWDSGSDEYTGKKKGKTSKGKRKARKGRGDESSGDDDESSESEVTSEHIRRWRAAWNDKY